MMQAIGVSKAQQATPLLTLADIVTALRLPLGIAFLLVDGTTTRFGIVIVAAVSDLVDGMWARRIGPSRLGAVLDPVCDKLFMLAAFIAVLQSGVLSVYEVVAVLLRDIVAAVAFLGTLVLRRPITLPARAGGKAVTVCQILTLVAFLSQSDLIRPLAWATAAISLYAIADYWRFAWTR